MSVDFINLSCSQKRLSRNQISPQRNETHWGNVSGCGTEWTGLARDLEHNVNVVQGENRGSRRMQRRQVLGPPVRASGFTRRTCRFFDMNVKTQRLNSYGRETITA
jgi:hypothetical protein